MRIYDWGLFSQPIGRYDIRILMGRRRFVRVFGALLYSRPCSLFCCRMDASYSNGYLRIY